MALFGMMTKKNYSDPIRIDDNTVAINVFPNAMFMEFPATVSFNGETYHFEDRGLTNEDGSTTARYIKK